MHSFSHSFIYSTGMCRMRRLLAVLRSFFNSPLLYTFYCHTSPSTILPPSLTTSCHLLLGLPLNFVGAKFIYNNLLGILFPSNPWTRPNHHYLFNLTVSVTVGFLTASISLLVTFLFQCHILGLIFFFTPSFQKRSFAFYLSLLVKWTCHTKSFPYQILHFQQNIPLAHKHGQTSIHNSITWPP
jgi:hypothetical protein